MTNREWRRVYVDVDRFGNACGYGAEFHDDDERLEVDHATPAPFDSVEECFAAALALTPVQGRLFA